MGDILIILAIPTVAMATLIATGWQFHNWQFWLVFLPIYIFVLKVSVRLLVKKP